MNNKLSIIMAFLFFGCHGPVKEENKNNVSASVVSPGQKYIIDTKESVVTWKGSKVLGSNFHTGYVYISEGELMIENGQLVGGKAVVDMNTIGEKTHGSKNELVEHIQSPDFFDVEKFPVSTITITSVESTNAENKKVTGNLTVKGITHPVTFPATMEIKDGIVNANGKLIIDRTDWGIRYKSGKFFDILADEVIADSIEFNIKIVAKK